MNKRDKKPRMTSKLSTPRPEWVESLKRRKTKEKLCMCTGVVIGMRKGEGEEKRPIN